MKIGNIKTLNIVFQNKNVENMSTTRHVRSLTLSNKIKIIQNRPFYELYIMYVFVNYT